jgi:hypothetical protein
MVAHGMGVPYGQPATVNVHAKLLAASLRGLFDLGNRQLANLHWLPIILSRNIQIYTWGNKRNYLHIFIILSHQWHGERDISSVT